jgi:predicted ATPase
MGGGNMLLRSIRLKNLLSFGPEANELPLGKLTVLIGPNGVGKSNLLEGIGLLQAAPKTLTQPISEGGGIHDWLWKGPPERADASLEVILDGNALKTPMNLRYHLQFTETAQRFMLTDERIENEKIQPGYTQPYLFYGYQEGRPLINSKGEKRFLRREDVHPEQSILAQRKDPDTYPEITLLGELFAKIRIYRNWSFGRYTQPRLPQKPDLPNDFLDEDCRNLGLVLNRLRREPNVKQRLLEALKLLYAEVDDFDVQIEGGTVQVFFQEGNFTVPATRLSDGTLRYLCLLTILCHPTPPPLICIEEPELGLHPDIIAHLGRLLLEAAERTQLIVTTHSDVLVDALTDLPEAIVVCEKIDGATTMQRLNELDLKIWLEKYSLGQLWRRGEIGGNRW